MRKNKMRVDKDAPIEWEITVMFADEKKPWKVYKSSKRPVFASGRVIIAASSGEEYMYMSDHIFGVEVKWIAEAGPF